MANLITDYFQIFIKPVGAHCNLRCSYCYYLSNSNLHKASDKTVMDDSTLESYIRQHFSVSTSETVLFTWHGGEPLLAGIDFYKKASTIQKKHLPSGKNFVNAIQTNGTLITREWCEFFAENNIAVGISLDGPEDFHNSMRQTDRKTGSFEKTIRGHSLLREYGITPEILCVVNNYNVYYPLILYDFFKTIGTKYVTFIPLVERDGVNEGQVTKESVPAFEFGLFLSAIFDKWVNKDIGIIKVQIFEEALRTAFRQEHSLCIFREKCGGVPVIERNGDFYSCDHFVSKNHFIGNINEHSLSDLLTGSGQKSFGETKQNTLPQYCIKCEVKDMCNGECPKNRILTTSDGEKGLNYLCEGYKYFFNHCKPFINSVSEAWNKENS